MIFFTYPPIIFALREVMEPRLQDSWLIYFLVSKLQQPFTEIFGKDYGRQAFLVMHLFWKLQLSLFFVEAGASHANVFPRKTLGTRMKDDKRATVKDCPYIFKLFFILYSLNISSLIILLSQISP